jgi:hypothetical protein
MAPEVQGQLIYSIYLAHAHIKQRKNRPGAIICGGIKSEAMAPGFIAIFPPVFSAASAIARLYQEKPPYTKWLIRGFPTPH